MTLADKLRPHVEEIKQAALAGDGTAQSIISLYQTQRRRRAAGLIRLVNE